MLWIRLCVFIYIDTITGQCARERTKRVGKEESEPPWLIWRITCHEHFALSSDLCCIGIGFPESHSLDLFWTVLAGKCRIDWYCPCNPSLLKRVYTESTLDVPLSMYIWINAQRPPAPSPAAITFNSDLSNCQVCCRIFCLLLHVYHTLVCFVR